MRATHLGACALLLTGCSWSRFDDVEKNTPVVLLNKPAKYPSFGYSLAASGDADKKSSRVFVGGTVGQTPSSIFELGTGTTPETDAVDPGACAQGDGEDPCYLAASVAAIGVADVGTKDRETQCFVMGAGKAKGSNDFGLIGRCADTTQYNHAVPADVLQKVIKDELIEQGTAANAPIYLAADRSASAGLVASAPVQGFAWYYQPETIPGSLNRPALLVGPPPKTEAKYGASGAVLRLPGIGEGGADRHIVAVGSPDPGAVYLFDGDNGGKVFASGETRHPMGCLGGIAGLGRTMTSGRVDGDAFDDLVVADAEKVTVFSGAALSQMKPAADVTCSLAALPPHAIIASFGCGSRDSVAGCPGGFATSLAVGDLDGDQDGEVVVGAPAMTAREKGSAGAVLVYDAEGAAPNSLTDLLFLASAEDNDALGAVVTTAPLEDRDVVVAGAPGGGRTALFYCSVLGGKAAGSRCE